MVAQNLLIEPLWNWNFHSFDSPLSSLVLLIEPLWNWNRCKAVIFQPIHTLLIEPLWNWNACGYRRPPLRRCRLLIEPLWNWNRGKENLAVGGEQMLLIEPLWNWNLRAARWPRSPFSSFNRTTMELKLVSDTGICKEEQAFNRTTMELKQCLCERLWLPPLAF